MCTVGRRPLQLIGPSLQKCETVSNRVMPHGRIHLLSMLSIRRLRPALSLASNYGIPDDLKLQFVSLKSSLPLCIDCSRFSIFLWVWCCVCCSPPVTPLPKHPHPHTLSCCTCATVPLCHHRHIRQEVARRVCACRQHRGAAGSGCGADHCQRQQLLQPGGGPQQTVSVRRGEFGRTYSNAAPAARVYLEGLLSG